MFSELELEVWRAVQAFNNAFAANDPEKYFSFVDDDITVVLPGCPYRIDGKTNDRMEFEYCLAKSWSKVGFFHEMQPKIQVFGDIALVYYYSRGAYGDGPNEKLKYYKETNILVKRGRDWKVIHVHLSVTV